MLKEIYIAVITVVGVDVDIDIDVADVSCHHFQPLAAG